MKAETTTVTKTITTTIYTAKDGRQFEDRGECETYEEELNRADNFNALKAKVDAIECIECGYAPFGSLYVDDDRFEYRWYRPKSIEEVEALNNFFPISVEQNNDVDEIVGKWVCIEIEGGYDDYEGDADVYSADAFEASNKKLVDFYAKLGYDVEIKKKQSCVN